MKNWIPVSGQSEFVCSSCGSIKINEEGVSSYPSRATLSSYPSLSFVSIKRWHRPGFILLALDTLRIDPLIYTFRIDTKPTTKWSTWRTRDNIDTKGISNQRYEEGIVKQWKQSCDIKWISPNSSLHVITTHLIDMHKIDQKLINTKVSICTVQPTYKVNLRSIIT